MDTSILFYGISFLIVIFSLSVLLNPNPIMSSLYLVMTMCGVAFIFFLLDSAFLAGIQLAVYAGAVMVLFVMVLMLFDIKTEIKEASKGVFTRSLKFILGTVMLALLTNVIFMNKTSVPVKEAGDIAFDSKQLAAILFTDYIFAFELLGVILLVIAVGAVALSRIKGGTHAK